MEKYPPIYLIGDMLDRDEILGLHKSCDCLTHLDRGEGFGLVPFEAGACGNPIMVTGWGGVTEYAKPEHSYLVDHMLTPVFGMPWSPFYSGEQLWAEPDCAQASSLMRHIFKNQEKQPTFRGRRPAPEDFAGPASPDTRRSPGACLPDQPENAQHHSPALSRETRPQAQKPTGYGRQETSKRCLGLPVRRHVYTRRRSMAMQRSQASPPVESKKHTPRWRREPVV